MTNKRTANVVATAALLAAMAAPPAQSMFMQHAMEKIPIARMIANLEGREKQAKTDKDRAMRQFQIGRLHSMAYAQKTEQVDATKPTKESPNPEPFYGFYTGDHTQFGIEPAKSEAQKKSAQKHLTQAIANLRDAVKLDPTLIPAQLGLAWCLDQSGKKDEALALYRQVFAAAWEKESKRDHGLEGASITKETGQYMLKLLNPTKDAAEIADVNAKCEKVNKIFRAVTPIVVPVSPGLSAGQLLDRARVTFDLDGNGPRTYTQWTNAHSGWLVYDDGGAGGITSGLQMFGQCTFWVFWRNGYEALSALDDNHDGELRGSELEKLAVWQDRNQNGVCEGAELRSLASLNIEALGCRYAADSSGLLLSSEGVRFADGSTAATYDVVLEEKTD
jgi:tetratricopeptide (TPR) repeat protein